jgi:DNA-binding transcriptional MerR regulator
LTLELMRKTFRVREFAALAGVTGKTLRHYDRVGLLTPRRTDAGYRIYSADDLLRLQQIATLKLLGFSLAQVRRVLQDGVRPLREALPAQRAALQERRAQIDRALMAIDRAEQAQGDRQDDTAVLAELMGVLSMGSVEVLKKYFTDEAWLRWRSRHDSWPSAEWMSLYRETQSALSEDPAGSHAQELARRCIALSEAEAAGDPGVRTALRMAMVNQEDLLTVLQAAMPDVEVERVSRFLAEAAWARWDAPDGESYETPRVRPRASASATALLHEFVTVLDDDPRGQRVQQLVGRWTSLLEEQSGGDAEVREQLDRATARWRRWPPGMRRWVASLYGMPVETWERVMTLIEAAQPA